MDQNFIPTIMTRYDINADKNAVTKRWFGVLIYNGNLEEFAIVDKDLDTFEDGIYRTDANFRNCLSELNNITHLALDFKQKTAKVVTQEQINQLIAI